MSARREQVSFELTNSLGAIDPQHWDRSLHDGDFWASYSWLRATEREGGAETCYLLAVRGGRLEAGLPVHRLTSPWAVDYQHNRFASLLGIDTSSLSLGTRLGYRNVCSRPELVGAAVDLASERGYTGVVIPYLPTDDLLRLAARYPVTAAYDGAEAVIEVPRDGSLLPETLSTKRRYTARRELRQMDQRGLQTRVEPLEHSLTDVCDLVSAVEQRHGQGFPAFLLRRILRHQLRTVDPAPTLVTCRRGDGTMVACSLGYAWRGTLFNQAIGLASRRAPQCPGYAAVLIYGALQNANQLGVRRLHLSVATRAKLQRGAIAHPLWTASVVVAHRSRPPGLAIVGPRAAVTARACLGNFSGAYPADEWESWPSVDRPPHTHPRTADNHE